ncbi:MAG: glycosyltransferase 87 family protein [Rhodoluna sp.]
MGIRRLAHLLALMVANLVIVFSLLNLAPIFDRVFPLNDVLLYGYWLGQMHDGSAIFGIAQPWVYPYPAMLPMLIASFLGGGLGILSGWIIMLALINFYLIGALTSFGTGARKTFVAAWFWLGSLAALGPVAVGRIDTIAAAVAFLGLMALVADRIKLAVGLFTFGAWIKIWPIALAVASFVTQKKKIAMTITIAAMNLAILILAIALGGNSNTLSFLFQQSARGIQIESPVATAWLWLAKFRIGEANLYFDKEMLTNQVSGGPVGEVSLIIGLLMFVALGVTAWFGWRAIQRGESSSEVFTLVALTGVLDLIVFNKVGSPQFMIWLAVPIISGILYEVRNWRFAIIGSLAICAITQLVYPIFYIDLMSLGYPSLILLTLRNVGLVAFLVWSTRRLAKL